MDKETKRRLVITLFGIIAIVALLTGISFAAFQNDVTGTKTQSMKTGCLKVSMTDNGNVSITNAAPQKDENGLQNTPYTYTLTNTCTVDASYITTINVLNGSNMDNVSKIKVSLSGDTYVEPTIESNLPETELVDESETTVVKSYVLDEGTLAVGESKTFNLRTWIDYDVTEITGGVQNKIIVLSEAQHNKTIAYSTKSAAYQVLKNVPVLSESQYSYTTVPGQTGLVKVDNSGNVKYYMRGNPNNYIKFGTNSSGTNYTWRVLSSNSDGSINLVYNGIYKTATYANLSTNLNTLYNDLKKDEKYIKTDSTFCEEKTVNSTYVSALRVPNHNPTSSCESNNVLTKIGILSADDLMYAGAATGVANTSFFLKESSSYFTASHASSSNVYAYTAANSLASTAKTSSLGIKPVITLSKDAIIEGQGTSSVPFYVTGLYTEEKPVDKADTTAPTIVFAKVDEEWSKENKTIRISAKDDVQGSGIAGYIIRTSSSKPSLTDSAWEASSAATYTTINKYGNGTYYAFVKDASGNISEGTKVVINKVDTTAPTCTIRINPNGEKTDYKTLSIISSNTDIDINNYSWDHTTSKEDSLKVSENGVYTAHIKDLAGNEGTCSATITTIISKNYAMLTTGEEFENLLRKEIGENFRYDFGTVTVLTNTTVDKSKAEAIIDVSANKDGSVEAIIVHNDMMPLAIVGDLNLYIVTEKEILYANPDSSMLFAFSAMSIDVGALNTSKVKNMYGMFGGVRTDYITGLDTWDTSNVINMSLMFAYSYYDRTNFDLSNFDTRSVTNAEGMFCDSITSSNLTTGANWTLTEADGLYTCPTS